MKVVIEPGKSTFIKKLEKHLKNAGYIPIVFHLTGPSKFNNYVFSNDDKSLIQLSKFNDEFNLFREILNSNDKIIIILDRTAFGEYIWSKYWNRSGKYTDFVTSNEFIKMYWDLHNLTLYINYYMSDIDELTKRIKESDEDKLIFTIDNKSIEENINYVYDLYEKLDNIIKENKISYLKINSSQFQNDFDKMDEFIEKLKLNYI